MKDYVIWLSVSFALGLLPGLIFNWDVYYAIFFILISCVLSIFSYVTKDKKFIFLAILCLFFSLGIFRAFINIENEPKRIAEDLIDSKIEIEGYVKNYPEKRDRSLRFVFKPDNFDFNILVYVEKFDEIDYGDRLVISGKINNIKNFEGLGGRIFDYQNYLGKDNIYYQIYYPSINNLNINQGSFIKKHLYSLKEFFVNNINRIIPDPENVLLSGILLGEKSSFSDSLEDAFIKTGLIHIVVLSGYNISIVADSAMRILSFASITASSIFAGLFIFLFALLTGFGTATVRASIMAILVLTARITGRKYDILKALFLAGFVMVFINPKVIIYDPGFALSFMATLGLILLAPVISEKLYFIKGHTIRELLSATLSTQIFVLPILLYQIGQISIIAPISNIVILPFVPTTMFVGFLTSLLGAIPIIGYIFGYITYLLLKLEILIVLFFSKLPFASIIIPKTPILIILFVYMVLGLWLRKFVFKEETKRVT